MSAAGGGTSRQGAEALTNDNHPSTDGAVVQRYQDPIHYFKFTPAGAYCAICGVAFVARWWRRHFSQKHPELEFKRVGSDFLNVLNTHIQHAIEDPNRCSYAKDKKPVQCTICTGCDRLYVRASDARDHVNKHTTLCEVSMLVKQKCLKMLCGRYFPLTGSLTSEPGASTPAEDVIEASNDEPHPAIQLFGKMPASCRNMTATVDHIIQGIVRDGDTTSGWRKVLHTAIATDPDNYLNKVSQDIKYFQDSSNIISSVIELTNLSKAYEMFGDNFGALLSLIPGNIKAAAVKFKLDDSGDAENQGVWTFRARTDEAPQRREFRQLVAYLYRRDCNILLRYLKAINDNRLSVHQIHEEGLAVKFLFDLCNEAVPNGDILPWICRFALSRCMTLDNGDICLRDVGGCSKTFATILYIMRQSILGCAALMQEGEGDNSDAILRTVIEAQRARSLNLLSPWIRTFRDKSNREIAVKPNLYDENGDIICGNAVFKEEYYSKLIPSIVSDLIDICGQVFIGDDWRSFIGDAPLTVCYEFAHLVFSDNFLPVREAFTFMYMPKFYTAGERRLVQWRHRSRFG